MDIDSDISTVLANLRQSTENLELIQTLYQLEDFYERRLWNQLSLCLEEFYSFEESKSGNLRERIFSLFIYKFHRNLNPIKTIDFLLKSFGDQDVTLSKLGSLKESLVSDLKASLTSRRLDDLDKFVDDNEAIVYINLQIARYTLLLGGVKQADEILDSMNEKFENSLQNKFSAKINAAFYLTKCEYYKIHENYSLFYTNGLLFLSSVEGTMSIEEKLKFCYDLCIAALLGDKIYNFGELILHDILNSISAEGSEFYWLYELIQNLNSGNFGKFNEGLQISFKKAPQLLHHQKFLHQKIVIMSLLELISLKLANSKRLQFEEISSVTGTPLSEVEFLIIKCLSLGLIRGYMNQIEQVVIITWLQPRILNLDQVKSLYNNLVQWDSKVEKLEESVHASGGTVWASG